MTSTTANPLDLLRGGINKSCPAFVDLFYAKNRYKVPYGGAGSGKVTPSLGGYVSGI